MSSERGGEAGRGRKRERLCVWIDHTMTLGEARVTSHEMAAVPGVGATITHRSLVLNCLGLPHMPALPNDYQFVVMMRGVHE